MSVIELPALATATPREARTRHYLMCPPDHFAVEYAINPWMHPERPVDRARARAQWQALREIYQGLGHRVDVLPALPGLPDMVFSANGAVVHRGRALGSRFAYAERQPEAAAHADWLRAQGIEPVASLHTAEGEGDFLVVGERVLAGSGFRTRPEAHAQAALVLDTEVISLELVDPLYYHLDTCLAVLDDDDIAYYPAAFSRDSRQTLERLFPAAITASAHDAAALGLNAVSDGLHVLLSREADELAAQLSARGYRPVPVEVGELRKAGGGVKCCTMEIRSSSVSAAPARSSSRQASAS